MQLYTHYKNGTTYEIVTDRALIESTKVRSVVYRCRKTGQVWVRPFDDFHGLVEQVKGLDVTFVPRFQIFPPADNS